MNKNGRSLTLRGGNLAAITLCLLTTLRAFAAVETAQPADALVDTIGVNIHLNYYDTAYNNYSTIIKPRLQELGIRHVRDGVIIGNTDKITKLQDLYNSLGIKSILIADPRSCTAVQARDYIKTVGVNTVAYAEGPNEPDISGNANWVNDTRAYQQALWNAIKGDPATANLPVVATSLTSDGAATALGNLTSYLDYGCIHNYYGGRSPETGGWGANGYGSLTA